MEAVAKIKNCPMSPRKMRLVADNIRGLKVDKALDVLKFTNKEASTWLEKLVLAAIANWEHKNDMALNADDHDLYVKTIFVNEGMVLKRFRPAPHGRAHRIRKRTNHVTLVVENKIQIDADLVDDTEVEETEETTNS